MWFIPNQTANTSFANLTQSSVTMLSIQIVSDLHLESVGYDYQITPKAPYLALLGDIGLVSDREYIDFLDKQLSQFQVVLHVLGNHEPYRSSWDSTWTKLDKFQKANRLKRNQDPQSSTGVYVLLYRGQHTIPETKITILGCTLFSAIPGHAMTPVSNGLSDFFSIDGWTVEEHCSEHQEDLKWLNDRVKSLVSEDPDSKIVILTHYSPTVDSRAVEARHADSLLRFGFQTDLANEECWTSRSVKLWAFGHTHFNCDFTDEKSNKRVYTNQRGYDFEKSSGFRQDHVVDVD